MPHLSRVRQLSAACRDGFSGVAHCGMLEGLPKFLEPSCTRHALRLYFNHEV